MRTFLDGLEQLERLAGALELADTQRRKDARDRAAGVLELVEVQPGIFARPAQPRPRPAPRTRVHGQLLELEQGARFALGAFEQLREALCPK